MMNNPASTEEQVERVARAIVPLIYGSREDEFGGDLPDMQFDDLRPDWQDRYRDIARAAIASLNVGSGDADVARGWRPISEAPKDGSIFYSAVPMKWKPYKPTSEQAKRGIKGRWMESNGYGGWNPATVEPEMFVAALNPDSGQGESQ